MGSKHSTEGIAMHSVEQDRKSAEERRVEQGRYPIHLSLPQILYRELTISGHKRMYYLTLKNAVVDHPKHTADVKRCEVCTERHGVIDSCIYLWYYNVKVVPDDLLMEH